MRASDATLEAPADIPAIENELPAYRAISPWAVASFIFGLLSVLSYASWHFLVAAGLAVICGAWGLHRISKQPDVLTGRGFAQAGVVLGLVCGLSSVTIQTVQSILLARRAEAFVRGHLLPVFQERNLDSALWYRNSPKGRIGLLPEQVRKMYEDRSASSQMMFEYQAGSIVPLIRQLRESPEAKVRFSSIETSGQDGVTPFAVAVLRIDWPDTDANKAAHQERGEYIAVAIKSEREGRREMWWVADYIYPYVPHSYQEKIKPVDDGHGHAH